MHLIKYVCTDRKKMLMLKTNTTVLVVPVIKQKAHERSLLNEGNSEVQLSLHSSPEISETSLFMHNPHCHCWWRLIFLFFFLLQMNIENENTWLKELNNYSKYFSKYFLLIMSNSLFILIYQEGYCL